jgi:hypothetical protein
MAGPPGQQRDPAASRADGPARASTPLTGRFLPRYDFAVVHTGVFRAPPEACYQAARRVNLFRAPVIRTLIRTWPLAGSLAAGWPDAGIQRLGVGPHVLAALPSAARCSRNEPIPGLEHSGVKRLVRTAARLRDSHGFLSSCGSAEAHVSAPERFRRSENFRTTACRATGIPLFLRSRR